MYYAVLTTKTGETTVKYLSGCQNQQDAERKAYKQARKMKMSVDHIGFDDDEFDYID